MNPTNINNPQGGTSHGAQSGAGTGPSSVSPSSASSPTSQTSQPSSSSSSSPSSSSHGTAAVVERVAQGAHKSIDQLQRGVQTGVEQARQSADQWSGSMRETVREHPLASVGGAFALGVIFARLMR